MNMFCITFLVLVILGVNSDPLYSLSSLVPMNENSSNILTNFFTRIAKSLSTDKLSEDGRLNFTGISNKYGFKAEEHQVTTEDGYILTIFRIPGDVKKIMLLGHGGTPTSDCWIIRGRQSLAIKLAQRNYDVWAINFRGSRYSRSHILLDPDKDEEKFFNFSHIEHGIYDLPATMDYILKKTGQTKMTAISHSLGTTAFFVMGAERPNYNVKIKLHIALAPLTYGKDSRGMVHVYATIIKKLSIAGIIPAYVDSGSEMLGTNLRKLVQALCINTIFSNICLLFLTTYTNPRSLEKEFFSTLFGHFPGGTSIKVYKLMIQNALSDKFAKFDYGVKRNLDIYHSAEPPEFELSKVTMKTVLVVGQMDFVSTVKDSQRIRDSLPNVVRFLILPDPQFAHLDFIYSRHMKINFFPHVFDILKRRQRPSSVITNAVKSLKGWFKIVKPKNKRALNP